MENKNKPLTEGEKAQRKTLKDTYNRARSVETKSAAIEALMEFEANMLEVSHNG